MNRLRAKNEKDDLGDVRRIVVKVGSAVIAGKGRLRPKILAALAQDLMEVRRHGHEVILVVSGAVAAGYRRLGMHSLPTAVVERQSAASVGATSTHGDFFRVVREAPGSCGPIVDVGGGH